MIMLELKERTKDLHKRTEQAVNLFSRLSSTESYTHLISRLYGFYSPIEGQLTQIIGDHIPDLRMQERLKLPSLTADLRALGRSAEQISATPQCPRIPQLESVPDAMGCLYVLEGSTLGGQIIRREAESRLGLNPESGCRFYTGYGNRTGDMWRVFCSQVDRYADEHPAAREQITAAAEETFRRFGEWVAC